MKSIISVIYEVSIQVSGACAVILGLLFQEGIVGTGLSTSSWLAPLMIILGIIAMVGKPMARIWLGIQEKLWNTKDKGLLARVQEIEGEEE